MEYSWLENKLQEINRKCIQINNIKSNNDSLNMIIGKLIDVMKDTSVLFKTLYERIIFNGSYYNNLKISKADEYDLDLILVLPVALETVLMLTPEAGYVDVKIDISKIKKLAYYRDILTPLEKLCENGIFSSLKIHSWFEGLVQKSLNIINASKYFPQYKLDMYKSGPAVTLTVHTPFSNYDMDLVPCLKLDKSLYPKGYKKQNCNHIYAVSKPNKDKEWRLSFIEQELSILRDNGHVKPAIRLLKFLRDQRDHKLIKSYFIVTVAMWDLETTNFNGKSLSFAFMTLLESLYKHICERKIPFYWNPNLNLLNKCHRDYLFNLENQLLNILKKLRSSNSNPNVLNEVFNFDIQES